MSRRLSKCSEASALPFLEDEDSEDESIEPSGRNSIGRRRQSFGGKMASKRQTVETQEEQNRIADMYKTIIKLSSENKINAKNSWNLDLINHMDKILAEETTEKGHRGVNFQKASCTLDASVKIYSHRVDDTYTSSYQVLENLSRNEHNDDSDNLQSEQKKVARVGTKTASIKHNLTESIERNVANLNASLESEYSTDPMFHKMSQAFDEGGAKGMLMANLRVGHGTSTIVFSNEIIGNNENINSPNGNDKNSTRDTLSVTDHMSSMDLIIRSKIDIADICRKRICPSLDHYRDILGISSIPTKSCLSKLNILSQPETLGHIATSYSQVEVDSSSQLPTNVNNINESNNNDTSEQFQYIPNDDIAFSDDDDDNNYFAANDDMDNMNFSEGSRKSQSPSKVTRQSICDASRIQWNAVFSENNKNSQNVKSNERGLGLLSTDQNPMENEDILTSDGFVMNLQGNSWAGAKHWKSSLRKRQPDATKTNGPQSQSEETDVTEEVVSKTTKRKTKKEKFQIIFTDDSSALPPYVINSTHADLQSSQLTEAAIEKCLAQSKSGANDLPVDAKLDTRDMCRLFMWPAMIVPPALVPPSIMKTIISPLTSDSKDFLVGGSAKTNNTSSTGDFLWGQDSASNQSPNKSRRNSSNVYFSNDNDMDEDNEPLDCNYYSDNDNDDFATHTNAPSSSSTRVINEIDSGGLDIRVKGGLLNATRTVEKVNIGYSTSSKIVNMKKLKADVWEEVSNKCTNHIKSEDKENVVSFHDMVGELAQKSTAQKQASMSFYFICLLHLANEKNLVIKDCSNLNDLMVSRGVEQ